MTVTRLRRFQLAVSAVTDANVPSNGVKGSQTVVDVARVHLPLSTAGPTYENRLARDIETERIRRHARRVVDAEERGPAPPLPDIYTLDQFTGEETSTWRIESWFPRDGRVVCVAAMKTGKTTLVGNLARSLLDGDPFLGRYAVTPLVGSMAILDTEMSPGQLKTWLHQQRIAHTDRLVVVPLRQRTATFNICDAETRSRWATLLRQRHVELLVLDCLRPVLDAIGLDEHREIGRFLVAFDALLEEAGIREAVIVYHMGHAGERSRGDSRIGDWPDVEWKLVRQAADPSSPRYIRARGRDVDVRESRLSYDSEQRRLTIAEGSRNDAAVRGALDAILDMLGASETPLTYRAIEEACRSKGHQQRAIRGALNVGVQSKQIARTDGPKNSILHSLATASASTHSKGGASAPSASSKSADFVECVSASECVGSASTHSASGSASVRQRPYRAHAHAHTPPRAKSRNRKARHARH